MLIESFLNQNIRVTPFERIAPRIGYINQGEIVLPEKKAYLFTCSKEAFSTMEAKGELYD